jgi:hypothetical protein
MSALGPLTEVAIAKSDFHTALKADLNRCFQARCRRDSSIFFAKLGSNPEVTNQP